MPRAIWNLEPLSAQKPPGAEEGLVWLPKAPDQQALSTLESRFGCSAGVLGTCRRRVISDNWKDRTQPPGQAVSPMNGFLSSPQLRTVEALDVQNWLSAQQGYRAADRLAPAAAERERQRESGWSWIPKAQSAHSIPQHAPPAFQFPAGDAGRLQAGRLIGHVAARNRVSSCCHAQADQSLPSPCRLCEGRPVVGHLIVPKGRPEGSTVEDAEPTTTNLELGGICRLLPGRRLL